MMKNIIMKVKIKKIKKKQRNKILSLNQFAFLKIFFFIYFMYVHSCIFKKYFEGKIKNKPFFKIKFGIF
jgi:hypothetical protein